jgi:hypothetical protein
VPQARNDNLDGHRAPPPNLGYNFSGTPGPWRIYRYRKFGSAPGFIEFGLWGFGSSHLEIVYYGPIAGVCCTTVLQMGHVNTFVLSQLKLVDPEFVLLPDVVG